MKTLRHYQKEQKPARKSYEVSYDAMTEKYILQIFDSGAMFPLVIKAPGADTRELILTQNRKLHLQ